MASAELCYQSAVEILRRFRSKELSPVDVMNAVIERAEAVEPQVNALAYRYFDAALESARNSETRYMKKGVRLRALEDCRSLLRKTRPSRASRRRRGRLSTEIVWPTTPVLRCSGSSMPAQ